MKCAIAALVAITLAMGQARAGTESVQDAGPNAGQEVREARKRLIESRGPANRDLLDAMALAAYRALYRVPHKGLRDAKEGLEALIALRKALQQRPGLPENLLALRLQQAVDAALLHEVIREHEHRTGVSFYGKHVLEKAPEAFNIPFQEGSLSPEVLESLLGANRVDEPEMVRHILGLQSRLAKGFQKHGATVSAILRGHFSYREMDDRSLRDAYRQQGDRLTPADRKTGGLADYLFAHTLAAIDGARVVRIVGNIYSEKGGLPHNLEDLKAAIAERIEGLPDWQKRRVRTGKTFDASDVTNSVLKQGGVPGYYSMLLSAFLHPFLRDLSRCPGFPSEDSKEIANKIFAVGWCLEFAPE